MKLKRLKACASVLLCCFVVFGTLTVYGDNSEDLSILFEQVEQADRYEVREKSSVMLQEFLDDPEFFVDILATKQKSTQGVVRYHLFYQSQLENKEAELHQAIETLPEVKKSEYFSVYIHVDDVTPFSDVKPSDWFFESVDYVFERQIMKGIGSDLFLPYGDLSRAMLITILYRMSGETCENMDQSFTDINPDAWYASAVQWAVQKEIIQGFEDNSFRPDDPATREQLTVILYRYYRACGTIPDVDYSVMDLNFLIDIAEKTDGYASEVLFDVLLSRFIEDPGSFADALLQHDDSVQNYVIVNLYVQSQLDGTMETFRNALNSLAEDQKAFFTVISTSDHDGLSPKPVYMDQFRDQEDISSWAKRAMIWALQREIILGSDQALLPQGKTTRAQMAAITMRYMKNS